MSFGKTPKVETTAETVPPVAAIQADAGTASVGDSRATAVGGLSSLISTGSSGLKSVAKTAKRSLIGGSTG